MQPAAAPDMGTFALYILLPMLVGAVGGAIGDRENMMQGIFVGGISGAVFGLLAMIALGHIRE